MMDKIASLRRNRDALRARIEQKIEKRNALNEEIRRMSGYLETCRVELRECCERLKSEDLRELRRLAESED